MWKQQPNPIVSEGFTFRDGEDEYDLKMQFAAIIARNPANALMAGYELFKGTANYGRAMQSQIWITDPIVQEEVARLVGTDAVALLLPTPEEVKKELWDTIRAAKDPKTKIAGIDLYSKIEGMQKGEGGGSNVLVQNVINLPRRIEGPEEEAKFARDFEKQQLKLVRDARAPS